MSLQTSLEMALRTLELIPPYGTREVLLVHGAHSTADAGPISATIAALQRAKVRVSSISLPGEVYVVMRTARDTGGTSVVPESVEHLRAALLAHCKPPPRRADEAATDVEGRSRMITMGFPRLVHDQEGLCACHAELRPRGFICPRCSARMCELPSTCALCRLQLVSAPALARSYHHLFPVPAFVEVPSATVPGVLEKAIASSNVAFHAGVGAASLTSAALTYPSPVKDQSTCHQPMSDDDVEHSDPHRRLFHDSSRTCGACGWGLGANEERFVCPSCCTAVCGPCEQLIHETLHSCPGCVGGGTSTPAAIKPAS